MKCNLMFDMGRLMSHFDGMLNVGNILMFLILWNLRVLDYMNILMGILTNFIMNFLVDFLRNMLTMRWSIDFFLVGFLGNIEDSLVFWLVLNFHSVELSLNVRNMMSLHVSFSFLVLVRWLSNDLFLMMRWSGLQMNWRLFDLCSCFNMFNGFRFFVLSSFFVFSFISWFAFLDLGMLFLLRR